MAAKHAKKKAMLRKRNENKKQQPKTSALLQPRKKNLVLKHVYKKKRALLNHAYAAKSKIKKVKMKKIMKHARYLYFEPPKKKQK